MGILLTAERCSLGHFQRGQLGREPRSIRPVEKYTRRDTPIRDSCSGAHYFSLGDRKPHHYWQGLERMYQNGGKSGVTSHTGAIIGRL